jgi:hypothetical protein
VRPILDGTVVRVRLKATSISLLVALGARQDGQKFSWRSSKWAARAGRIDRGARDRAVAEPSLDRPGVAALIGQRRSRRHGGACEDAP